MTAEVQSIDGGQLVDMGGRRVRQGTMVTSCFAAIFCVSLLPSALAQFGGFGGPAAKEAVPAVKSDLPYIRCSVCEALAKNAYRQIKAAKDAQKPGKKLPELELLEMVERMGNPSKDEGEWIAKIDLVESGKILKLEEQEDLGKCGSECRTIQKAAEEILEEHDTDIAEKLWQGKQNRAQFTNWLCYELSGVCKSKAPPLPKDRKRGPAFEVMDPKEAEMEKMLAGMKDMGMGGQVYDRNTIENMVGQDGQGFPGGDDDEDDEEDEAGGKSALDSSVEGAKDVLNKAKDAAEAAVGHAKEGLSKAFSSAKDMVSGFTSKDGKAEEL